MLDRAGCKRASLAAILGLAAVSGCVSGRATTFIEAEYAPYRGEGSAAIRGRATLGGRDGHKACHYEPVLLFPATSVSKEWFEIVVVRGERIEAPDPRVREFTRTAKTGPDGSFAFDNLPPGEYIVVCPHKIRWSKLYLGPSDPGWGIAHAKVAVSEGHAREVEMVGEWKDGTPKVYMDDFMNEAPPQE